MNIEFNMHYVTELNIVTKHGGNTDWVNLVVTDRDGKELEITLFAADTPIILTVGEKE